MTLDEAIKDMETIAEENQRVVDTGIVVDDITIDMLYCDDTEVIEEHLANYQRCAEEHRQLAEWLKDYKRLLEQEPCDDVISRNAVDELSKALVHTTRDKADFLCNFWEGLRKLPPVTSQPKTHYGKLSLDCGRCDDDCSMYEPQER